MGVLRAAGERGVDPASTSPRALRRFLPAFPECVLAWTPENAVGELGRAEAGEADQVCLLVRRRRPMFGLNHRGEPDRGNVLPR